MKNDNRPRQPSSRYGKPLPNPRGKPGKAPYKPRERDEEARKSRGSSERFEPRGEKKTFLERKSRDFSKPGFKKFDKKSDPGKKFDRPKKFAPRPVRPVAKEPARPLRETHDASNGNIVMWGLHAVRAAWLNPKRRIHRVWLSEAGQKLFAATQAEAKDALLKRPDAKQVERQELDRLTPPGSVHQGIVIETAPLPEPTLHDVIGANPPPDLLLLLDQVTDPHNVGAILRSAAAFGAGAVVMTERNAPNSTGVLAKTASGALDTIPLVHVVNLARTLEDLREAGYWCVGLAEEGAKNLGELDLSGRTALVLGNEGEGLRHLTRQKCDELARLPTGGEIGSLNVSNAAAVGLYEVRRQSKRGS